MIYKFERLIYGGVEPFEIDVPDYVKFVKYYEYGERQQMWMFMMLYDEDKYEELSNKLACYCHKFGDETDPMWGEHALFICYMGNVKPLQELPKMTMYEFNQEFHKHIEDIYVAKYKYEPTGLIDRLIEFIDKDRNFIPIKPIEIEKTSEKIIAIYHFKGFTDNNCDDRNAPMVNASVVSFNHIFHDNELNMIEDGNFSFNVLFNDNVFSENFYSEVSIRGFDTPYTRKKFDFNKRVKEITENL